ncbi:MAG: ABC transporter permease subunit [Anaerolineales bacterium]|nr:ABC transporter permease subunit [Anaerolineales bacterium]
MAENKLTLNSPEKVTSASRFSNSGIVRIAKYTLSRVVVLAITVVVSVFLVILVANLGGYLDVVKRANIDESIGFMIMGGWLGEETDEAVRNQIIEETRAAMIEAAGLNQPFLLRCVRRLWDGLTLNWGYTGYTVIWHGVPSSSTRDVIIDYLPRTLLVFGSANVLLFFISLFLALGLSRKYGSFIDKLVTALAPLAAAPSWVYGLIIIAIGIHVFHMSITTFDEWPDEFSLAYLPFYARHLLPPIIAIFVSKFFQSIYAWRTLFLVNSSEDYVEIARAKGMPDRMLERRYILRPVLPNVLTNFALILMSLWQEVIILESIFAVAGVGNLFRFAVARFDAGMIVALVVTFAYLLAITVFLLDIAYALVDPRVKVSGSQTLGSTRARQGLRDLLRSLRRDRTPLPPPHRWEPESAPSPPLAEPARLPTSSAPSVVQGPLLLRDTAAQMAGPAGRAMHEYILASGRRLAEGGLLVSANDVFWLTRDELKRAEDGLASSRSMRPFNQLVRERWTAHQSTPPVRTTAPGTSTVPLTASAADATLRPAIKRDGKFTRLKSSLRELSRYPSALVGLGIILLLILVSIYTIVSMPYKQSVGEWRGDHFIWMKNPTYALPIWVNWFRSDDLPPTITADSRDESVKKTLGIVSENTRSVSFTFPIDFPYQHFPSDLIIFFESHYQVKKPLVVITWVTPDGQETELSSFSITSAYSYYVFQDKRLMRKLDAPLVEWGMFGVEQSENIWTAVPGHYEMRVTAYIFEEESDMDAEMVLYGRVHGPAGTDGRRRDVMMGLLWGTPVALAFGLLAAMGTTLTTIILAATGTWLGGWIDSIIQRLTEINMVVPFFPVSLMIYTLYSKSFWVILGVTVLLSIFGISIKNYRSLFLQIKELPYFEAAQAYGASNWRIIFRYLIPRIGTILIPQMVIMVPSYVFLEAALSILGLYDPLTPPTWGQLVLDGLDNGINQGAYHLALEPAFLLLLTGYAFLLLGMSLERVFEPRLREI